MTQWGVVKVGENFRGDRGRVFEEHRTTNTHGQMAIVDDIRGLRVHSSVGTHSYCWWWRSKVILGSYELRTERGVGYDHEGRN